MPESSTNFTANLAAHNAAAATLLAGVADPALSYLLLELCDQHKSVLVSKQ